LLRWLRRFLVLVILGGAAFAAWWMLAHRPAARRRPPKPKATLVEARVMKKQTARVSVSAMGVVKPAREVILHPRVQGEVRALHRDLVPGGLLTKGEVLVRIDSADYLLAVRQAESALSQARASLEVEKGRQAVVRRELALLGSPGKDARPALILREPQLKTAEAAVQAAEASLARARLDLERTTLKAPWNAVVLSRSVDVGSRVTTTTSLVRLAGADAYWVELVVPMDQLRHLRVPSSSKESGAKVRLRDRANWGPAVSREGRLIKLVPDLEEKGRLAKVLVEVEDPLGRAAGQGGGPRLQLGAFVEAEIEGEELTEVFPLERRWLREGTEVWVVGSENRLDIRTVTILHRGKEQVLVSEGLRTGDRVVTSELVAPVKGMLLKVVLPRGAPDLNGRQSPEAPRGQGESR
jgi:RND family efflux transporter MFP subunit